MANLKDKLKESLDYLKERIEIMPEIGVILGSGLGPFAESVRERRADVPFGDIPYFRHAGVEGHEGNLAAGIFDGVPLAILQGRYHYYEGHAMEDVVYPVQLLGLWGIRVLIVTNAAGGINENFIPGDLMMIRDHINMMGVDPLRGGSASSLGPYFPDLTEAYSPFYSDILEEAAKETGIKLQKGVYAARSGPSYETPAEIKMLRRLGADAVGMSTVPEIIAANQMGIDAIGISCITNQAAGMSGKKLSHAEVKETADRVRMKFSNLLGVFIRKLAENLGDG